MLSRRATLAALLAVAACKDSPDEPKVAGPPAQLVPVNGANQSAPANTPVPQPMRISIRDANGTPVGAGHTVTFAIVAGGGNLVGEVSVTSDANGEVTAPQWVLGKSNVPQTLQATLGSITTTVSATIATQYDIIVRYYGTPVSAAHQALFEGAAARLEAIITGDVVNANANLDLAGPDGCDEPGLPRVNETVDDIVIYATITSIDGTGNVLGQATPCVGRGATGSVMVAYGYMKFDAADFPNFANPQEVILHEMLHVLGSGTLWNDRNLITGQGTNEPRFTGTQARQACAALGATVSCATSVPLENTGGTGTRDFHWRETTFGRELMTGFYNSGVNPLSTLTIASMADLGFVVNNAAADPYTFIGTMQMSGEQVWSNWERIGQIRSVLRPDGRPERVR